MKRGEAVEIVRDVWGVPHIFAETERGAVFGQGYAMAEDRLPTIMKGYRKAMGRMAEFHGPEWTEHDWKQHLYGHEKAARNHYESLPASYQEILQAFTEGIRRYVEDHPDHVPDDAVAVEPWHPLALGRSACMEFVLRQLQADLDGTLPESDTGRGSNAWAVTPRKTTDGQVILHIDPHVPWADEWLWHESHLHGGGLHVYGFQHPGKPYAMVGHNERIAWTLTAGGPDVGDVYELKLNPENRRQYLYEGKWRDLKCETIEIRVRTGDGFETVTQERLCSHHGYVAEVRGDRAYVFADAYGDFLDGTDMWGEINKAANVGDFIAALDKGTMLPINLHYSDVHGNIYYHRAGHVPIRPEGVDPKRPIPGDTSATEWLGFHDTADHPQVLNPPCGWFQNCNISPESVLPNSPMTVGSYPHYMLHGRMNDEYMYCTDGLTPRGRRAFELLSAVETMTWEDALEIAHDSYMMGSGPAVRALTEVWEAHRDQYPQLKDAIDVLRAWDGYAKRDRIGVSLFWLWFREMKENGDVDWQLLTALVEEKPLTEAWKQQMLPALERAADHLRTHFGTLEVRWEQLYRIRRGEETWAADGAECFAVRVVSQAEPGEGCVFHPTFGQSCAALVSLGSGGVRSASTLAYGISEDPASPHYTDQGRLLFAENRLKDTWFHREELEGHITSRKILTFNV